ncbi:hypothetical protein QUA56_10620 [Microcoleus sp. N3A4]
MRDLLATILFDEDDWESAHLQQKSVVKAQASDRTKAKARTKRTDDNLPVHIAVLKRGEVCAMPYALCPMHLGYLMLLRKAIVSQRY